MLKLTILKLPEVVVGVVTAIFVDGSDLESVVTVLEELPSFVDGTFVIDSWVVGFVVVVAGAK